MKTAGKPPKELIDEGQSMVQSLAAKIYRNIPVRVELDDLIAYGQVGLAQAAREFDPEHGIRFTTYAFHRIRGAIYDGLSEMSWTSRARYRRIRYEQMASETLRLENEATPPSERASLESEARWLRQVAEKLAVVYLTTHRDEGHAGGDRALEDPAEPPSAVVAGREISRKLRELIDTLPPPARRLIRTTYFEGATLQEAADRLGISKSWASRLHAKTLEQLARSLRKMGVSD